MKKRQWQPDVKRTAMNKQYRQRQLSHVISSMSNSNDKLSPLSPSETIKHFYICINEKNSKKLGKFIAHDCFFEDLSFPCPFQGKKEVLHFFEQLITCMGQNIQFNLGCVCERDEHAAAVNWHLEWKKKQVPFTRGCSIFELSKEGDGLLIKKAQVVIESPFKLGVLALNLLKIVTSVFDAFPEATESKVPEESLCHTTIATTVLQHIFGAMYKSISSMLRKILEFHGLLAQLHPQNIAVHFKAFQQVED
ncbi:unnamed protein product [Ilex paraguariensis]|uniref:SnoaL-like domain-containing protein n=1 Tax=Ilex paraguariensis TaxID=185542 RepID=A0ABC8UI87_9AQUA